MDNIEQGCWVTYYTDRSGVNVFASEVAALRHAVEHGMQVGFVPWGQDVWEATR